MLQRELMSKKNSVNLSIQSIHSQIVMSKKLSLDLMCPVLSGKKRRSLNRISTFLEKNKLEKKKKNLNTLNNSQRLFPLICNENKKKNCKENENENEENCLFDSKKKLNLFNLKKIKK